MAFFVEMMLLLFPEYFMIMAADFLPPKFEYIKDQMHSETGGTMWIFETLPIILMLGCYWGGAFHKPSKRVVNFLEIMTFMGIPLRIMAYTTYFVMRLYYYSVCTGLVLLIPFFYSMGRKKQNIYFALHCIFNQFIFL